ncbi:hypothetical protein PORY_002431 [Pneumocystis oryctolagi]|uniref:Uncharacterized protein n=1 Tax=Pneumocystis oryctolagi TaxID=42067 RepID=A0ACB7C9W5_9ASCO|nr:hypothetical protein PORY_002431 [Pneumocystis oryctolagi]
MLSLKNDEEQSNNKGNTTEYTLQGVIHFLQAEAYRYQRDRNNWEIEHAEMKARIIKLEGEQKGLNKLKDLHLKRIKILEDSLQKERDKLKHLSSHISNSTSHNVLNKSLLEKNNNESETSFKKTTELNELITHVKTESCSKLFSNALDISKDVFEQSNKRAKSLHFLEKCLQEITYLVNTQMDILDDAPALCQTNPAQSHISLHNAHSLTPILSSINIESPSQLNKNNIRVKNIKIPSYQSQKLQDKSYNMYNKDNIDNFVQDNYSSHIHLESAILNKEEVIYNEKNKKDICDYDRELLLPDLLSTSLNKTVEINQEKDQIHKANIENRMISDNLDSVFSLYSPKQHVYIDTGNSSWDFHDDAFDEKFNENDQNKYIKWNTRFALRNHLASIRSVSMSKNENSGYASMATCGDDGLVKFWRLPVNNKKFQNQDIVPQITYRGHSGIVTSVCIATKIDKIFSAGIDSSIRCWKIPEPQRNIYAPMDEYIFPNILIGHSNAVWDLSFQSTLNILASISADGTIKLWDINCIDSFPLLSTLNFYGNDLTKLSSAVPTSVTFLNNDIKKIAVSWNNAIIKIYDTETSKSIMELRNDEIYDGTNSTQINKIISHSQKNMLISGHENKYIRFYDINSAQCTYSILAHLDAVSSLDISPDGEVLISSSNDAILCDKNIYVSLGHDASVRFWDMQSPQTCIQEISNHRIKAREGVNDISWWYANDNVNQLEYITSVGGDGVIKVNAKA